MFDKHAQKKLRLFISEPETSPGGLAEDSMPLLLSPTVLNLRLD
jgi:hypothetical protein